MTEQHDQNGDQTAAQSQESDTASTKDSSVPVHEIDDVRTESTMKITVPSGDGEVESQHLRADATNNVAVIGGGDEVLIHSANKGVNPTVQLHLTGEQSNELLTALLKNKRDREEKSLTDVLDELETDIES